MLIKTLTPASVHNDLVGIFPSSPIRNCSLKTHHTLQKYKKTDFKINMQQNYNMNTG